MKIRSVLRLTSYYQHILHRSSQTTTSRLLMSTSNDNNSSSSINDPYIPPKVWKYENSNGSKMTMNRPTAGARTESKLPVGTHPIQLYSLATPNGQKVTILLEELLEIGKDAEYDAWYIDIFHEDQFGSDFTDINPNSKIPAMKIINDGSDTTHLFESGSILLQLAERFDNTFLPTHKRAQVLNWLMWQMGSAPYLGGGFGHFYEYADVKQKYPIDRFTMEIKRQLDVLNNQLENNTFMVGDEYTIADIAIFPWYGNLVLGRLYGESATFLDVQSYPNVLRWAKLIDERPGVKRGRMVNRKSGLKDRHAASDFQQLSSL